MSENRIGQSISANEEIGDQLLKILRPTLRRWRFIVSFAFICAIIAGAIAFLIPNEYTATSSILPTAGNSGASGLLSMAENVSGIDLSAIGTGDKSPSLLYPEILRSRRITEKIIDKTYLYQKNDSYINQNLYKYLKTNNPDKAIKALEKYVNFATDRKTGMITINVSTDNPQLSALVANYYLECLDDFNKYQRKTNAGQNREFIEKRMAEAKAGLTAAEENLRDLRQRNLNYYNATDPELNMLHNQLRREVEVKNQVYLTLCQQYELASIQEKKELPVIQVLDTARPPTVKSGPSRLKTVILAFIMGGLTAVALVFLEKRYPKFGYNLKSTWLRRRLQIVRASQESGAAEYEHVEKH